MSRSARKCSCLALQNQTCGKRSAFTLIEVVLAVTILAGMLGGVLSLYQRSASLRHELEDRMGVIAAARLLLDHMTAELEAAVQHAALDTGFSGTRVAVEFLTSVPATGRAGEALRFVQYQVAGDTSDDSAESDGDFEYLDFSSGTFVERDWSTASLVEGEGIARRESPFILSEVSDDTDAISEEDSDENSDPVMISSQLRVMGLRYYDGSDWSTSWSRESLPLAVEITVAADGTELELTDAGHRGLVFSRVVALPAADAVSSSSDTEDQDSDSDDGGEQ